MRMRPLSFLALAAATGCGITFAPGDFSGPGEVPSPSSDAAGNDSGPTADGGTDTSTPGNETGPAPASLHVVVFAEPNDVWLAPVSDRGDLGAFGYLQPTPLPKPLQAAALSGGRLLTVVQGTSSRVVQTMDVDGGTWTTGVVPSSPTSDYGSFFAKSSLVVVGGQTSAQVDDGMGGTTTVTTNHVDLLVSKSTGTQYPGPNNVGSATKLPAGLFRVTSVLYKDFVYVWGQGDAPAQANKVYVGKADETLGLASITETAAIVTQDGKAHTPTAPIACAGEGRLFVIAGSNSSVTVSADIAESTGALGAWKTGPSLPVGRSAAGCAVFKGWVYVFGGLRNPASGPTGPTDEILRSKVSADGTLSEWEVTAQKLPGARANVFALTY